MEPVWHGRSRSRDFPRRHLGGRLTLANFYCPSGLGSDAATSMVVCPNRAGTMLADLACRDLGSASPAYQIWPSNKCRCLHRVRKRAVMPPQALFGISVAFGFVAWGIVAAQYLWPELRDQPRVQALRSLLILHCFRFIGLAFLIPGVVSAELPAAFAG